LRHRPTSFFGFTSLPQRGVIVTNDLVNPIREDGKGRRWA
jgi:hypothetical protein